MAHPLFKLYHRLPSGLRSIAASIRGYQLRNLRFGPETERLAEEAIERETFTWEQWNAWREEKLRQILRRAATRVPFYREQWSQRRARYDQASFMELGSWPVLRKEPLRRSPVDFLAEDCDPRKMWWEHTSGSTGTPLTLWQSRETIRFWHALFEARWRYWYDVSRQDRWAILGGQLVVPARQENPPFWVWNSGLNQLYLSANHLSATNARHYIRALFRYKVKYLWGYASALHTLATFALSQEITLPVMSAVISNAEPLWAHQKAIISKAFGCCAYDNARRRGRPGEARRGRAFGLHRSNKHGHAAGPL
jgi:phenylacetate-CoA ligase